MTQTRRFLGGRHPLCGIGVTSRIERICRPAVASAWIADSRPEPGPCTRTCTRRTPRFIAPRPLLGARVGVRALAPHRQSLAMPRAAVRPDVHQPLDVHRDLGAQRALDLIVPLDHLAQPRDLRVPQVANPRIRIDPGLRENLLRVSRAEAVDVRESVQNLLVARQVDARNACHVVLSLPLLVLGTALADDADDTPPLDHLTMLADRFDARPNLQTARSGEKIQLSLEL